MQQPPAQERGKIVRGTHRRKEMFLTANDMLRALRNKSIVCSLRQSRAAYTIHSLISFPTRDFSAISPKSIALLFFYVQFSAG